jgi:hypothetical protein
MNRILDRRNILRMPGQFLSVFSFWNQHEAEVSVMAMKKDRCQGSAEES